MKINYQQINFVDENDHLSYKNDMENKKIFFNVCFYSDKFKEYQKNLFNDFYSKILSLLEKNEIFIDFKKDLENNIKQFNTQLKVFQEKINSDTKTDIRGNLQITWGTNYLSAIIGESSIIIFRNQKLESLIPNEVDEEEQIDIFGEIIEGELENNDKIITVCSNVYNYITDQEIKELITEENVMYSLKEILNTRVEEKELGKIEELNINIEKIKIYKTSNIDIKEITNKVKKYKYPIGIIVGIIIIFFILLSIVSYLGKEKDTTIEVNGKKIETNLSELKRKIDKFGKLDNTNTQNAKQTYNEIIAELKLHEENNIQSLEIQNLRKKVKKNYYKGFNINLISTNDGLLKNIYKLNDNDLKKLGEIKQITKNNSKINIIGTKGVLLGAINNEFKGSIQAIELPTKIKTCTENLSSNGVFCLMENNDIYNISKYGIKAITNSNKKWPENIVSIDTYGKNKLYLLTKDSSLNKKNIFINRYILISKNYFGSAQNYVFSKDIDENIINSIDKNSTMEIDGNFLIWSKNGLIQAFRKNPAVTDFFARIIDGLKNGKIEEEDFSGKVKPISNIGSKYIHLYDQSTNSLVTYLTSPYKTNIKYNTSYKLVYKYKTKFDINNQEIKDIIINYTNTQKQKIAYVLTNKNIYKLNLNEFEE